MRAAIGVLGLLALAGCGGGEPEVTRAHPLPAGATPETAHMCMASARPRRCAGAMSWNNVFDVLNCMMVPMPHMAKHTMAMA